MIQAPADALDGLIQMYLEGRHPEVATALVQCAQPSKEAARKHFQGKSLREVLEGAHADTEACDVGHPPRKKVVSELQKKVAEKELAVCGEAKRSGKKRVREAAQDEGDGSETESSRVDGAFDAPPFAAPLANHRDAWYAETQKRLTATHASYLDMLLLHVARNRLDKIDINASARKYIDHALSSGNVSSAVTRILELNSPLPLINDVRRILNDHHFTAMSRGILELFTEQDLKVILAGVCFTGTLGKCCFEVDHDLLEPDVTRRRLLIIGLLRYSQWHVEMENGLIPGSISTSAENTINYENVLGTVDQDLMEINVETLCQAMDFLKCWDDCSKGWNLDKVLAKCGSVRNVQLLARPFHHVNLKLREIRVNSNWELVPVLAPYLPKQPERTLVLSGESGSGKTFSAIALGKECKNICCYMTAWELFASDQQIRESVDWAKGSKDNSILAKISADVEKVVPKDVASSEESLSRNERYAAAIVNCILSMDRSLRTALPSPPRLKDRLLIVVDEAGSYPGLVRSMCSPAFKLNVTTRTPAGGTVTVSLNEYLKVKDVQMIVVGTGVSVVKEKIASVPDSFEHVVMDSLIANGVIDNLNSHITKNYRWLEAFRKTHGGSETCAVLHGMSMVETNARMLACFAYELSKSSALKLMQRGSGEKATVEWHLTADAHYYAELKSCLARAMLRFKDANGLNIMAYKEVQKEIFSALGYSCLHWQWQGLEPTTYPTPCLGVLVDRIERQIVEVSASTANDAWDSSDGCRRVWHAVAVLPSETGEKLMQANFFLKKDCLHRFSVSPAHVLLALTMLGVHGPTGTRLGYEAAVCDLVALHTLMALNTDSTALPIADAAAAQTKMHNHLFNDIAMDPMRRLKELVWQEARALRSPPYTNSEAESVLVMRTTLPVPRKCVQVLAVKRGGKWIPDHELKTQEQVTAARTACKQDRTGSKRIMSVNEKCLWRRVKKPGAARDGKTIPVIPVSWLIEALSVRVKRQMDPFFKECRVETARVIVIAMLYQDAPGIDAVVAYGNYSSLEGYRVKTLVKLQTKYHEKDTAVDDDDDNDDNQDEAAVPKATRPRTTPTAAVDEGSYSDILTAMGSGMLDEAPMNMAVLRHLVAFDDDKVAGCGQQWSRINNATFAEAMHPTTWRNPGKRTLSQSQFYEAATQCIGI